MSTVTIDSGGRLSLPHQVVKELGRHPLKMTSHSPRHLLLTAEEKGGELVMAGELGAIGIPDLLSFFNMFRKTGVLCLYLMGGEKELSFQQGEIVFASTTFPEEDIGEILCTLGKLDRKTLHRLRPISPARGSVGKILVEKGVLSAKDLWHASRHQAETILYNLFSVSQGSYSFVARPLEDEQIVRLSMSTQNLIMEGLRRVDEKAFFMRRILSLDHVPAGTGKEVSGLPEGALKLLELIGSGGGSVRQVLARFGQGEYDGLRQLHLLLEKKAVLMEEPVVATLEGALGEVVSIFNGALAGICRRVLGTYPEFRQEVQWFIRDLPQPYSFVFREVSVRGDGSVDGSRIIANLAGLEEGDKGKLLAEALGELLYMECGVARRELPEAESTDLVRRVQEVSRRVKTMIGRI